MLYAHPYRIAAINARAMAESVFSSMEYATAAISEPQPPHVARTDAHFKSVAFRFIVFINLLFRSILFCF